MKIRFDYVPDNELENTGIEQHWIAAIDDMPGLVESGKTKQDAFNELMKSLRIKLAFDNGLKYE